MVMGCLKLSAAIDISCGLTLWGLTVKRHRKLSSLVQAIALLPDWHQSTSWISADFLSINTLRPRQNGRHFADDTFKCIFLKENVRISIKISLNFVPKSPIDNIPALFQIMAWRRPGDKPLSEAMIVSLLTHICVAWPQWVKPPECVSEINVCKMAAILCEIEFTICYLVSVLLTSKKLFIKGNSTGESAWSIHSVRIIFCGCM